MQAGIRYTVPTGDKLVNETFGPNNIRRRTSGAEEIPNSTPSTGVPSSFFSVLPKSSSTQVPAKSGLSFQLVNTDIKWSARALSVRFAIQYVKQDGGNQQGRIIILARGPKAIWVYPDGALSRAGMESLFQPSKGEYFSVSRFRQTRADFTAIPSRDSVTDVEVMEAARQYVRKVSGFRKPSKANEAAFEQAIADIAEVTQALLDSLVVKSG